MREMKLQAIEGRIAVTGGTGFIGRHLVAHLIEQGRNITLLVQDETRCPSAWQGQEGIRIVQTGPLEVSKNLNEALAGVSCVLHLGGLAHLKRPDRDRLIAANAEATLRLCAASAEVGVGTFLHLSSIAAISDNAATGRLSDSTPPRPSGPYGESKLLAEKHVAALSENGMFAVSLRPPLVVGPDAPGNWRTLQRLAMSGVPLPFGGIKNRRSYIGVNTLVDIFDHLLAHHSGPEKSGAYCIANADALSLAQVLQLLRQAMNNRAPVFGMAKKLLSTPLTLLGRRRTAQSLFGNLEIDSDRFCGTFGFLENVDIGEEVRRSGSVFARKSSK